MPRCFSALNQRAGLKARDEADHEASRPCFLHDRWAGCDEVDVPTIADRCSQNVIGLGRAHCQGDPISLQRAARCQLIMPPRRHLVTLNSWARIHEPDVGGGKPTSTPCGARQQSEVKAG